MSLYHTITWNDRIHLVASERLMRILDEICPNLSITYNEEYRRSYIYECVFLKHALYDDSTRNHLLCPLIDILQKNLNGYIVFKEYTNQK